MQRGPSSSEQGRAGWEQREPGSGEHRGEATRTRAGAGQDGSAPQRRHLAEAEQNLKGRLDHSVARWF